MLGTSTERTLWLGDLEPLNPRPTEACILPLATAQRPSHPSGIHTSWRLSLVLKGKRLNRKHPGKLSPVRQDSRQPSLQKSTRLLRSGGMNPLASLYDSALCT